MIDGSEVSERGEEASERESGGAVRSQSGLFRVVRGFGWLAVAKLAGQLIGIAVLAVVVRRIGEANFGAYQFAVALTGYFLLPMNFGFEGLGIRDIARRPDSAREVAGEVLAIQLAFGALAYVALVVLAAPLAADPTASDLIPIVGLTLLVYGASLEWVLLARRQFFGEAAAMLTGQVVFGILTPLVIVGGVVGTERYALLNVVGLLVAAVFGTLLVWRGIGVVRPRFDRARVRRRVRRSMPLGISFAAMQAYSLIDIIILGYLGSTSDVGIYAAAYRLPLALIGLAILWVSALFPYLSQFSSSSHQRTAHELDRVLTVAIVVSVPMLLGACLLAEPLMTAFFGAGFQGAAAPFGVLTAAAAVIFVSSSFINALVAAGDERRLALVAMMATLVNVAFCVALIPFLGALGAALATVATEAFMLGYAFRRATRLFGRIRPNWNRLGRGLAATVPMACFLLVFRDAISVWILAPLGGAIFAASALSLSVVKRRELALVIRQ